MIFGVICEFNPFHDGHKYLIDSIKGKDDYVLCAMSGSFVQRGECAVYSKFDRAETAVKNGADIVFELVSPCSTLSAQGFAQAGVELLESTGVCDALAFGAECDDIDELTRIANEIKDKDELIKEELKSGCSYPAARKKVIDSPVLDEPNNILALEYISSTKLKPVAVKRIGKGHDSDDKMYSASEIRKTLSDKATMKACESAVLYKLRTMSADDFKRLDDVSEGLENRICEAVKTAKSLDELYDAVKTKRYTHSRIRRIILRAFLDINKDEPKRPQYLRILALSERGRDLLPEIKKHAALPVITKYSEVKECSDTVKTQFEKESIITDIHALCFTPPRDCNEDKTKKLFIHKSY